MTLTAFSAASFNASRLNKSKGLAVPPDQGGHQHGFKTLSQSADTVHFGAQDQADGKPGMTRRRVLGLLGLSGAAVVVPGAFPAAAAGSGITPSDFKKPPFVPNNVGLLWPDAYPDSINHEPVRPSGKSEGEVRSQLEQLLTARKGSAYAKAKLKTWFDSKLSKQLIPPYQLRAAMVSLFGTSAEAAVPYLMANYQKVDFLDPWTLNPLTVATVVSNPGEKPVMFFNRRFETEDIRLLGKSIAHETLHKDRVNSANEEFIAFTLEHLLYAELLKEAPSIAAQNTEISRNGNAVLMALLNTRDSNGKIHLARPDRNVFPGGNPFDNYKAYVLPKIGYSRLEGDTPGNLYFRTLLANATDNRYNPRARFDDNTVGLLNDKINNALSANAWAKAANALELRNA